MRVTMGWVGLLRGGARRRITLAISQCVISRLRQFHPKWCETSETEMATWLETMFRRPVED
jgi:hypothetical protein